VELKVKAAILVIIEEDEKAVCFFMRNFLEKMSRVFYC
jgi:hypothetical protein